ncbi:MAG: hypothetical protein AAFR75_05425 [Pseudomonadota bacterium]
MRTIGTLLKVVIGYALACLIAGAIQVGFVVTPFDLMQLPLDQRMERLGLAGLWALFAANQTAVFAAPFALVAICYGLWNKIRTASYYVIAGTLIGLFGFAAQFASERPGDPSIANIYATTAYVTAGALAGWIYWVFAGRSRAKTPTARRRPNQAETSIPTS